jgi:hypothetical protein
MEKMEKEGCGRELINEKQFTLENPCRTALSKVIIRNITN